MASKKKSKSKKSARSRAAGRTKKRSKTAAPRKTAARKKTTSRKKTTARKRATSSRKTSAELRKRAAQAETAQAETEIQAQAEAQQAPDVGTLAMSLGGLQIPDLDLSNIEDTVQGVVKFVEENPVAAAAMALGAGVVLTSMYWDKVSDPRDKRR